MAKSSSTNKFKSSYRIIADCAKFLKTNKDLLIFPIISFIASILFIIFTAYSGFKHIGFIKALPAWSVVGGVLITLFMLSFISILSNAALIACTTQRLRNNPATIGQGMSSALRCLPQLLGWSLISSTVGILINILENSHNILKDIIGYFLSVTWSMCSYFVLPILVIEKVGPITALKSGAKLFGRKWKRSAAINVLLFLIMLSIIALIAASMHFSSAIVALCGNNRHVLFVIVGALSLALLIVIFIMRTLNAIVLSALYLRFVKNESTDNFHDHLLDQLIVKNTRLRLSTQDKAC